jgi:23S rRNA (cytidine1920-2'-O)/16S rRNA (cytidine1409-2'-O)-methyltransferase
MSASAPGEASRAGAKLAAALDAFGINPDRWICADLGSNAGGFVAVLLQRGAARVYAVERGYGVLAWGLRTDPRVVLRERTDARHVHLPEPVDLVTIDVGWTRQEHILPAAQRLLRPPGGFIVALIKPHYEAPPGRLRRGVLPAEALDEVLAAVRARIQALGLCVQRETASPILGRGGNHEFLWQIAPGAPA